VDNDGACRLLPEVRLTRDRPVVTFGTDEVVSHCNREATVVVLVKGHRTELGVAQIEGRWGQLKGDVPRVPVGLVPGDLTGHDAAGVTDLEVDAVRVSALLEPGRQRDAAGLVARIAVVHRRRRGRGRRGRRARGRCRRRARSGRRGGRDHLAADMRDVVGLTGDHIPLGDVVEELVPTFRVLVLARVGRTTDEDHYVVVLVGGEAQTVDARMATLVLDLESRRAVSRRKALVDDELSAIGVGDLDHPGLGEVVDVLDAVVTGGAIVV